MAHICISPRTSRKRSAVGAMEIFQVTHTYACLANAVTPITVTVPDGGESREDARRLAARKLGVSVDVVTCRYVSSCSRVESGCGLASKRKAALCEK